MIRTETEYQEARRRFKQDLEVESQQREYFISMGLTPEQVEKALEPIKSFHAQLSEEITWYENISRGRLAPIRRLTDIGRLLIGLRIASGMTQKQLAEKMGVHETIISRDERNDYHGITVQRAQKILDALTSRMIMRAYPDGMEGVEESEEDFGVVDALPTGDREDAVMA